MKNIIVVAFVISLSGCSGIEKQSPVCTATSVIGGAESEVNIYGVRKISNRTEFKAGYPFNWRWVNKSNFTSSTCE